MLGLAIPAVIVLAAVVGPSSAVVMIPRPINYPVKPYLVLLDDAATLFPKKVPSVAGNFRSALGPIVDNLGPRPIQYYDNPDEKIFNGAASLTSKRIALAFKLPVFLGNTELITHSLQSFVEISCQENILHSGQDPQTTNLTFGNTGERAFNDLMSFAELQSSGMQYRQSLDVDPSANLSSGHTLLWRAPPTNASTHSILLAEGYLNFDVQSIDGNSKELNDNRKGLKASADACLLDAYWAQSAIKLNNSGFSSTVEMGFFESDLKVPISISPEWAEKLTSLWFSVSAAKTDAFHVMAPQVLAIGISDAIVNPKDCASVLNYDWDLLTKNSSSRSDCFTNQQFSSLSKLIKDKGLDKKFDSITTSFSSNWTDASALTQLDVHTYKQGYGYDSSSRPVRLSLAVLMLYCLIVAFYIIATLITGRTASSWDSTADLVMLGLNSRSPMHLDHTSVGVETLSTFREPVSIRVNEKASVELVFDRDARARRRTMKEVEPNVAY
ncbi:MAG: hypothetical protein Q9227_002276 [Pyrenula ochraceoflavens]